MNTVANGESLYQPITEHYIEEQVTSYPKWTLLDRFYEHEKSKPNARYLIQPFNKGEVEEFTWGRVGKEARSVAAYLHSQGIQPGDKVAILSKNCAHWIMADLAIMIAGCVSVPIYPTLHADSVRQILEHSEAKFLFLGPLDDPEMVAPGIPEGIGCAHLPRAQLDRGQGWSDIISNQSPLDGSPRRLVNELCTLVYTSGSTGQPKGTMLAFGALSSAANGSKVAFGFSEKDRVISYLPLAHVYERAAVEAASLNAGCEVYFTEGLATFVKDLQRAAPTVFHSVPRLWVKFRSGVLAKMPERKLNFLLAIPFINRLIRKKILTGLGLQHVRFAASASAPLSREVLSWYRKLGLDLLEAYGMTENFGYSHGVRPGQGKVGIVGTPYDGVEQRISEEGEVQVRSPGTMMGYFKEPEKTAETFTEDGWFRTGDRGEIDAEGRLRITGRTKELFKTSKGKYVAPAPIENKLGTHTDIGMVCVSGADHTQPCALVMLAEDVFPKRDEPDYRAKVGAEFEALLDAVNSTLSPHEQLAFLVVVKDQWLIENSFLTPTMKIKRNRIEEEYAGLLKGWYGAKSKVIWQ